MKTNEYISLITSLIAVICSLIALFHVCPRVLGLDYLGIIVGILSFLITLLLGWNIYTVIDFKNKAKGLDDIEKILKEYKLYGYAINGHTSNSIADILAVLLDPRRLKGKEVDYITHRINAMVAFSRADRIEDCNRLASDLIDFLENGPGSYVDKDTRVALFYILDNTSNRESINDFHRLCALLLKP